MYYCDFVDALPYLAVSENLSDKYNESGPSYAPILLRFGIPHENGYIKYERERLMKTEIGRGRKTSITTMDDGKTLLYTVETNKLIFCREINETKEKRHIALLPEVKMYSSKNARKSSVRGYTRIKTLKDSKIKHHKFKVL